MITDKGTAATPGFPAPSSTKPGVVFEASDGQPSVWSVRGIRISRNGEEVLESAFSTQIGDYKPELFVTERRVVFVNRKLGVTRRNQVALGHIRYEWLADLGMRAQSIGMKVLPSQVSAPALSLTVHDGEAPVQVDFTLLCSERSLLNAAQLIWSKATAARGGLDDYEVRRNIRIEGGRREFRRYSIPGAATVDVFGGRTVTAEIAKDGRAPTAPTPGTSPSRPATLGSAGLAPPTGVSLAAPAAIVPSRPAAWHRDPKDAHEFRYWDGVSWTAHVSDAGIVTSDPL